jgi:adenine-specific DNA methylase
MVGTPQVKRVSRDAHRCRDQGSDDPAHAAKRVWDNYYANHQKKGAFKHLKVADIFMGGGTTLVEGSRLGMQMSGNDLNPVA